jgi:hypothetical protein
MNKTEVKNYLNQIMNKSNICFHETTNNNLIKMKKNDFSVLTIYNYEEINQINYTISQLIIMAKQYKLTSCGSKQELIKKIYFHLHFSFFVIKIQKIFRGFLQRKFNNLFGPALAIKDRKLCVNNTDFITLEELDLIPYGRFFSFKESENFIYGFDFLSIYKLLFYPKCVNRKKNPYNRTPISVEVENNVIRIIHIAKILNIPIFTRSEKHLATYTSLEKTVEMRAIALFQHISSLGITCSSEWFLSLPRNKLVKFIHQLFDVWMNRADLTHQVKTRICYPSGNPFKYINMNLICSTNNDLYAKKIVLDILENFVNLGIDSEHQILGCYYVIGALALVNDTTASTFPWLFDSFN